MCPSCGYNFTVDQPIELDGFKIDPRNGLTAFNGMVIKGVSRGKTAIMHTIAKAGGDCVLPDAILNRVSDSEDRNVISVHVSQMRTIFAKHGMALPFHGSRSGYRWGPKP
jgi:DNA-binding response OmpR family regulator